MLSYTFAAPRAAGLRSVRRALGWGLIPALAILALARPASAQEVEMEGTLQNSTAPNADGAVIITVLGVEVVVPATALIQSATSALTPADIGAAPPLPGRAENGFLGGTAIVIGEVVGPNVVASEVFVEPAEHVLLGPVTANGMDGLFILGVRINMIAAADEPRFFTIVTNGIGVEIDPATIAPGTLAGAEGYLAADGQFYAAIIEAEGGDPVEAGEQITIARVRCRDDRRIEVQGGSTDPEGTVQLFNADTLAAIGGPVAVEPDGLGDGTFRIRVEPIGACPANVLVRHSNGAEAVAAVTPE